jgi:hypothetical protein
MVIMTRHLHDPVPDPRARNPKLNPHLCARVMRMMAKNKEDRYSSYSDLIGDLESIPKQNFLGRLFSR